MVYGAPVQIFWRFPECEGTCSRWRRDPDDSRCFIDEEDEPQRWLHPFISPCDRRHPFWFLAHNSCQLRFRTLSARFTIADQIAQRKENYNYEHKLSQLLLLDFRDCGAGYVYTPDPDTMLPQQDGRREFVVISRTSLNPDPRFGEDFLHEKLVQSSSSTTMPRLFSTRFYGRGSFSSADPDSLERMSAFR